MELQEDVTPLKVGIIGTGFGSIVQYPAFLEHPSFEPIAIAGKHASKTATIAKRLQIEHHYNDWNKLIDMEELDVISVVTPPQHHHDMTLAALNAGKHVLCEKPLSTNLSDAESMYHHAEDSGLIAMIDLVFRFIPSRAHMLELIKNDYLGEIYQLDINVRNPLRLNPRTRGYNWWSSRKQGGGVLNALGTHYIDFIYQVFGNIERVSGQLATHIPKRLNKLTGRMKKVTSDDAFISLFDMGDNKLSTLNISTTAPYGKGPKIDVFGSEGRLTMLQDQTLLGAKLGEQERLEKISIPEGLKLNLREDHEHVLIPPFTRMLDELSKSIRTGRSLHPNFEDGVKIQKVIEGIRSSSTKKKWVNIE